MRFRTLLYLMLLAFFSCKNREAADKIYINANIWTGDSSQPSASVIAIKDNKIIYVGDDENAVKGSTTELIDLQGKMLVPGFVDNHTHFLMGGYGLASVKLKEARSKQQFIDIIKQYCIDHPGNEWIMGGDWDHENWGGELPRREWIDSVTGEHPLFIQRYDGHMAFANSKALALAKVTGNSIVPEGGVMIKDTQGNPTGVFKDEAFALINPAIPAPSEKQMREYLDRAAQYAVSLGVTGVNDMGTYGGWPDLATYRTAHAENKIPLRIYSFVSLGTWQKLDSLIKKDGRGDDMLHWGGLKGFVDGSLGSTTAWFHKPYKDDPSSTGLNITDTNLLRSWVIGADKAGLHVAVHAIGDKANDFILGIYDEADKANGSRDRRFRVEHAQHVNVTAIQHFADQHVIASMHPYHLVDDGIWAHKRLDDERLAGTYAFRSMLNKGVKLTFGSDWTVAPINPMYGIYAAITRRTGDGKNPDGWFPNEKMTVEEALKSYTANNAFGSFQEDKLGVLKVGMLADFVVLSEDLFKIKPENIKEVSVLRTIVNGKEVYKK